MSQLAPDQSVASPSTAQSADGAHAAGVSEEPCEPNAACVEPPTAPEDEQPPSSLLQIVPGHYTAPMSIRAAARFAKGPAYGFGISPIYGLGAPRTSRVVVVALVGVALLAAGGVGTALAFRFGGAGSRRGAAPTAPISTADADQTMGETPKPPLKADQGPQP